MSSDDEESPIVVVEVVLEYINCDAKNEHSKLYHNMIQCKRGIQLVLWMYQAC